MSDEAPLVFADHFSVECAALEFRKDEQTLAKGGVTELLVVHKAGSEDRLEGECLL